MSYSVKVGTRPSKLALKQVEEIKKLLPGLEFKVVPIETKGDKDKKSPLLALEGTDFFTYEIEKSLLDRRIDVAIHSAKDLEKTTPAGLIIAAITRSIDPFDCLISGNKLTLSQLESGSSVGTSSKNRQEAIRNYRRDLVVADIRGNVDDRIAQLDDGKFDAIIVAKAALIRLGLNERAVQTIPFSIIRSHPLQGRLAVQIHRERIDLLEIFGSIHEN